jgi:hypothetical protein
MTHKEAEIERLKIQIATHRGLEARLGDEWLKRVQRLEIHRLVKELKELNEQP